VRWRKAGKAGREGRGKERKGSGKCSSRTLPEEAEQGFFCLEEVGCEVGCEVSLMDWPSGAAAAISQPAVQPASGCVSGHRRRRPAALEEAAAGGATFDEPTRRQVSREVGEQKRKKKGQK
jgi:hypothetical protein